MSAPNTIKGAQSLEALTTLRGTKHRWYDKNDRGWRTSACGRFVKDDTLQYPTGGDRVCGRCFPMTPPSQGTDS